MATINECCIPELTAESLESMDDATLRSELAKAPHDSEAALVLETELKMRAPNTTAVRNIYQLASLEQRALAAFAYGLHLCALPKKLEG